jgi:hypothetical protein
LLFGRRQVTAKTVVARCKFRFLSFKADLRQSFGRAKTPLSFILL